MTERTAPADGRVDTAALLDGARQASRLFIARDFARIAEQQRSVISAVLLGALAASRALPFERARFEEAIERGGVGVASSRAAFGAGFDAAAQPESPAAAAGTAIKLGPRLATLADRVRRSFPAASHDILLAGIQRLADYQDERYAAEYLDRLEPIRAVDAGDSVLLNETGRYLALWMSYEDAIRVADLKIRRARFARVRDESRASNGQVVNINEFLHPGVSEFADIAPERIGRWLLQSGAAKAAIGWVSGNGTVLQTTSLSGFARLYFMASLRPMRRGSLRFRIEQAKIAEWLAKIPVIAKTNYALAIEVAQCPRLVKGYGETHERGSRKFDDVMRAVAELGTQADAAPRIKTIREAALAEL
jgi:indolepyruvate ferredoxin oxidoreductase beta subunit